MQQGPRYLNLPAPGAADAVLAGAVLGLALLGFLLVEFETGGYSFTIRNFDEMKWLALGAAAALGALLFAFGRLEATRPRPGALDLLLLLLLGWMAVSLAWSPDPARGAMAVLYGGLLLVLYGGVRVLRPERAAALVHGVALTGIAGILALPLLIDDEKLFRGFGNPNWSCHGLVPVSFEQCLQ